MRNRFARFFNLPELMTAFRQCADIKTADQLDLNVPEAEYHIEVAKPTEHQVELVQALSDRAVEIHNGRVDPSIDNMLKITSDGRKLGLDQRILNPLLPDEPGTKVNMCVRNILQIYKDTADDKLTQLVFSDISTPKGNGEFNIYDDIKSKLVANGVPASEIAFIHDAKNDKQKEIIFSKVRSGDIRILLGSTQKMGAGTNVQKRLIALHDLDCPWKPGDLEQRSGRIIRQGNQNAKVHIYRYVTEGTFDAYLWQIIENKQRFISQIMTSKTPVRDCADIDEVALSYAEIKSLCAGNPKIKERMDLDVEVTKLKLLKSEYDSNKFRLEDDIRINYPNRITKRESHIEAVKQDLLIRAQHPLLKDDFVGMEIHGVRYTDKKSAGAAIIDACKLLPAGAEAQHIGNYRGFQMDVAYSLLDIGFTFVLRGSASYRCSLGGSPEGNIQRIDNLIASLDTYLEDDERSLVNLKNQLEIAKVEVDKPFSHEEELKEKSARLARLDAELNIDQAESDINIEVSPDEEWLDFIENGGSLRDIPEENLNVAICTAAVEKSHYAFNYVPDRFKTAELCETAVLADVSHFQNVPAEYATPQLAEKAFEKSPWAFEKIPDCAKTPSLCERAVQQQSGNLAYVPEQFKSKELCLSAFEKAASVLKYIPAEFLTDEMCITAINSTWLSLDDIPDELRTFDVCLAAVAKRAFNLSAVPEGLKTPEFYATACKAYSQTHSDTLLLNRIPSAIKDQVLQLMHKLPEKGSKESTVTAKSSGKLFDINSLSADAAARAATRNSASADLPNHNDHSLDHK